MRGVIQDRLLDDLVDSLDTGWDTDTYGPKPRFNKELDRRVRGIGKQREENLIIRPQREYIEYSLGALDLLHTASASIIVDTSVSHLRLETILSSITDIIVNNKNREGYLVWRILGVTDVSHDAGRNYYSGIIDVRAEAFNPQVRPQQD